MGAGAGLGVHLICFQAALCRPVIVNDEERVPMLAGWLILQQSLKHVSKVPIAVGIPLSEYAGI